MNLANDHHNGCKNVAKSPLLGLELEAARQDVALRSTAIGWRMEDENTQHPQRGGVTS